jgi:hypothetical protein
MTSTAGGGGTLTFSLDGKQYEIDLSDENAEKLRQSLAPFVQAARKAGTPPKMTSVKTGQGPRNTADRQQTQAIRDWARANGHEISDRGRIPGKVLDAFNAAH